MYKTQVHIYWKLNERYLIGKRYTVLKVLETPCLRPSSSQLCPSHAERWWVLGQRHHFRFHVWSYFQRVILLPFSRLRGCKLCSAHVLKQCLYNKHSRPTRTAFIHQLDSFTSEILTLCPAPPTHKAGRILLAQRKGCPFSQGCGPEDPPRWKKHGESEGSLSRMAPPTTRGGNQEAGGGPHATAPVLKYKATGEKRTIPQKHSTNLGVEAKGQWATPLPSEGGGLNDSTYR